MQGNDGTPIFGSRKLDSDKKKKKSSHLCLNIDESLNRPNSTKNIRKKKIEEISDGEKKSNKKSKSKPKSIFKSINYSTNFVMEYTYNLSNNPLINLLAKKFTIRNDFDRKHSEQFLKDKIKIFEGFDIDYKSIGKK